MSSNSSRPRRADGTPGPPKSEPDESLIRLAEEALQANTEIDAEYFDTVLDEREEVSIAFQRVEVAPLHNEVRWFGHFVIVDGAHYGSPLLRAWRAPKKKKNEKQKRPRPSSYLWADFVAVTGLKKPPPLPLRKPEKFVELFLSGCIVRASTRRTKKGYSVVDRILRLESGKPPILLVRKPQ